MYGIATPESNATNENDMIVQTLRAEFTKARQAVRNFRRRQKREMMKEVWDNIQNTTDMKLFWKQVSTLRGGRARQPLSLVRDPCTGLLVNNHEQIINIVKTYHQRAFNGLDPKTQD